MSFKIKDGVRIGTVDVFNSSGETLNLKVRDPNSTFTTSITPFNPLTANRTLTLQDKSGTVALLSDVTSQIANETLQTITVKGATTDQAISITNANDSTTTASGALIVTGGIGVGKNLTVGAQTKTATLIATGNTTLSGANAIIGISPTGTGTVTISPAGSLTVNPTSLSTIDNTTIGGSIRAAGYFTDLQANGNVVLGDANTDTITVGGAFVNGTALKSSKSANDTLVLSAYDVDGAAYTSLITLTAGNTPKLDLVSIETGSINNMSIGASTASTGRFTTIQGTDTTNSTSKTTGALVTAGGLGVSLDANIGGTLTVGGSVTIGTTSAHNLTVAGNLIVNGTTTTVNSTTVTIDDPIFTIGGDTAPTSDDNKDRGIEFRYYNGSAKLGYFGFDDSTGKFTFIPDATNTGEVFSGTKGTIDANIEWTDVLNRPNSFITFTDGTNSATPDSLTGTFTFAVGQVSSTTGLTVAVDSANDKVTFSHADTSSVADLTSANNTFITAETYDTYGHVLTRTTGTVDFTVAANYAFQNVGIATDSGYTWGTANTNTTQAAESNTDTITFVRGLTGTSNTAGIDLYTSTVAGTDAIKIAHADTSSQATVTNTGKTYIQSVTLDEMGHVTALSSQTVPDYSISAETVSGGANLRLSQTGNVTGTDDVKFIGGGLVVVEQIDTSTIKVKSVVADDTATNATYYPTFLTASTGDVSAKVASTKLTFTPSSGNLYAEKTQTTSVTLNDGSDVISAENSKIATVATANVATQIDSWPKATYRSAKYLITVTQGTFFQTSEILVFNDGTTSGQMTEYGVISTSAAGEATFTIDASGTDMILKAVMPSSASTTYKLNRTLITI